MAFNLELILKDLTSLSEDDQAASRQGRPCSGQSARDLGSMRPILVRALKLRRFQPVIPFGSGYVHVNSGSCIPERLAGELPR